jgi:hypothetical protein
MRRRPISAIDSSRTKRVSAGRGKTEASPASIKRSSSKRASAEVARAEVSYMGDWSGCDSYIGNITIVIRCFSCEQIVHQVQKGTSAFVLPGLLTWQHNTRIRRCRCIEEESARGPCLESHSTLPLRVQARCRLSTYNCRLGCRLGSSQSTCSFPKW